MASKNLKIIIKKKQELVRTEKEKILSRLNEIRVEAEALVKKVNLPILLGMVVLFSFAEYLD